MRQGELFPLPPPNHAGYRPEEFKPIPCAECACVWRRVVPYKIHLQHRLQAAMRGEIQGEWWFCFGCGAQLKNDGSLVAPDDKDAAPERAQVEGGR